MTNPYEDFTAWFSATPGAEAYTRARGMWVDGGVNDQKRFAVFQFAGGGKPDVDMISPTVDVLLVGKKGERNTQGSLPDIENFAYSLVARSMVSSCSGKITGIKAIGLPQGPGFTTEDRPWYRCSFELTGVDFLAL